MIIGVARRRVLSRRGFFAAYNLRTGRSHGSSTRFRQSRVSHLRTRLRKLHPRPGGMATGRSTAAAWCGTATVYDPETNTVIAGTGNAEPWPQELRSIPKAEWGKWDALYTCSIVAVDAKTGKLKWYYQTVPTDPAGISIPSAASSWLMSRSKARRARSSCRRKERGFLHPRPHQPWTRVHFGRALRPGELELPASIRRTTASRSSIRMPSTIRTMQS